MTPLDRLRPQDRDPLRRWDDHRDALAERIDDARQLDWIGYRLEEVCDVWRD